MSGALKLIKSFDFKLVLVLSALTQNKKKVVLTRRVYCYQHFYISITRFFSRI